VKDFYELTNRGQAMRLRTVVMAALEYYDLEVARVRLLSNDFNGIFRVDTADGQKHILRVCLPEGGHGLREIRSEMMWLAALRRDTALGVPQPLATREGEWVTTLEIDGVPGPRHCVVFGWVPGPDLAEKLTLGNLRKLGELAALLHDHAATFTPPGGFWLKTADSIFPFGEPVVLFDEAYRSLLPPERLEIFRQASQRAEAVLDRLYADRSGLRVIHNDLHQWNVKVYRGKLYALDFEDLMWGFPMQDIAITLFYLKDHEAYPALREAFAQGYTSRSPWPECYSGEIEALVAGRGLNLANFVLQDPNPEWQQAAPAFLERTESRLRAYLDSD
jgi:Ser/Thr protein kinase RdoA (MazF antagonist)